MELPPALGRVAVAVGAAGIATGGARPTNPGVRPERAGRFPLLFLYLLVLWASAQGCLVVLVAYFVGCVSLSGGGPWMGPGLGQRLIGIQVSEIIIVCKASSWETALSRWFCPGNHLC